MNADIDFLKLKISDLTSEILMLKSETSYLKGKLEAYEWFLKKKGFIKGDDHAS